MLIDFDFEISAIPVAFVDLGEAITAIPTLAFADKNVDVEVLKTLPNESTVKLSQNVSEHPVNVSVTETHNV